VRAVLALIRFLGAFVPKKAAVPSFWVGVLNMSCVGSRAEVPTFRIHCTDQKRRYFNSEMISCMTVFLRKILLYVELLGVREN
jgi:hypothetical protein